ncbi:MAG: transposase [Myxococcota bacterium]
MVNRALDAEMTHHLGHESGDEPQEEQPNRRNGWRSKTLRSARGEIALEVLRDRRGSFEPDLIGARSALRRRRAETRDPLVADAHRRPHALSSVPCRRCAR